MGVQINIYFKEQERVINKGMIVQRSMKGNQMF